MSMIYECGIPIFIFMDIIWKLDMSKSESRINEGK